MPAVDPKTLELESCQLSMICTRVTSYGLGTEQGLGLGGTPRPEEKGRMCQNLTLGLSFDKPSENSETTVLESYTHTHTHTSQPLAVCGEFTCYRRPSW